MSYRYEDIELNGSKFEYMGETYDCSDAIARDKKTIINEAYTSHKDNFDKLYDKDTLKPKKVRVEFVDDVPKFGMVIYTIDYREGNVKRSACGDYYKIYKWTHDSSLTPHPYQGSICW